MQVLQKKSVKMHGVLQRMKFTKERLEAREQELTELVLRFAGLLCTQTDALEAAVEDQGPHSPGKQAFVHNNRVVVKEPSVLGDRKRKKRKQVYVCTCYVCMQCDV